jgi:hypothetical protein
MKSRIFLAIFGLSMVIGYTNVANASPDSSGTVSTFAKCSVPSLSAYRNLFKQFIVSDLRAKGYRVQAVNVAIKTTSPRTSIKMANIAGLQSLALNGEGTGYQVTTSGDLSVGCVTQATLSITGSYVIPANSATKAPAARKVLSSSQTVSIAGAFN